MFYFVDATSDHISCEFYQKLQRKFQLELKKEVL